MCDTNTAMYKTRNTGEGNGMLGMWRMRGMLYSREGSGEHSGECPETFRGISQNIPGNVAKQVTILLVVIFI